jgi:hypothetical protein
MKKLTVFFVLLVSLFIVALPAQAADQIHYTSQPDEVVIFLNNIAFARDTILLPGDADVAVVLPDFIYQDTLVLWENDERVPNYRINRNSGQILLQWHSDSDSDLREVTLEYLLSGISWMPKYDMWIGQTELDEDDAPDDDGVEIVDFDFFAEVTNTVLTLDAVAVKLVAGRVDTSQQLDAVSTVTMNQYVAGYDRSGANMASEQSLTGQASIQHVYDVTNISAEPGDMVYIRLQESTLPARRLHLWNAQMDDQVAVIYKVRNETDLPLAEGIVRTYENGLFIGSDFVELTPIGGEGSVTVGNLQNTRVARTESSAVINSRTDWDTQHDITLSLVNFGTESVEVVVIERYPEHAIDFVFSHTPERQGDNLFRWEISIPAGETVTITYRFTAYN